MIYLAFAVFVGAAYMIGYSYGWKNAVSLFRQDLTEEEDES